MSGKELTLRATAAADRHSDLLVTCCEDVSLSVLQRTFEALLHAPLHRRFRCFRRCLTRSVCIRAPVEVRHGFRAGKRVQWPCSATDAWDVADQTTMQQSQVEMCNRRSRIQLVRKAKSEWVCRVLIMVREKKNLIHVCILLLLHQNMRKS